jgi:C4-dicarboxylate-specific signal transduction histidine kinase
MRRRRWRSARAEQELRAWYREYYRRLAHETSNPLSVMKTYLGVIRQRSGESAALDHELALLDKELDRVAAMVQGMAQPPESLPTGAEGRVDAASLLEDLRLLYAEALFGSRGIGFEMGAHREPVWARIPRDALKQVLLNLFKNASEALQSGQRFSVALIPAANFFIPCLGIRLSDNGQGIRRRSWRVCSSIRAVRSR